MNNRCSFQFPVPSRFNRKSSYVSSSNHDQHPKQWYVISFPRMKTYMVLLALMKIRAYGSKFDFFAIGCLYTTCCTELLLSRCRLRQSQGRSVEERKAVLLSILPTLDFILKDFKLMYAAAETRDVLLLQVNTLLGCDIFYIFRRYSV